MLIDFCRFYIVPFGAILIACALLESIELLELILYRPRQHDGNSPAATKQPLVSFHVPTCSEPPDVVAKTLLALSKLNYDAYEVLVIDNNTKDDALWRPIEALCAELGSRFRFFHLPKWPGFKAGALNFALGQTTRDAELICVIDADYEIFPNYLAEIIGHFEDRQLAFVQTPQDYRNWAERTFLRVCYWEYWQVFAVSMMLRNRRNAILMHGTMNLVRKSAIEQAGGWDERCLTEDSELGLRLHARGYRSIYIGKTFGRGLIPFTFRDYKRQRRRWVIGGAQQMKQHWRLFLLPPRKSPLTVVQKLYYLQGWLPWFRCSLVVLSLPAALVLGTAEAMNIAVPSQGAWLGYAMTLVILQLLLRQGVIYRDYLGLSWRDTVGATLANFSLTWAVGCGWLSGLTRAGQIFQRTPKRPPKTNSFMASAMAEMLIGALALLLALAILFRDRLAAWPIACGLLAYALLFLPAAWMAKESAREPVVSTQALREQEDPS